MKSLLKVLFIFGVILVSQFYVFPNHSNLSNSKYSIKYNLKEGDVLTYAQVFKAENQADPDREEKYILQMEWVVKIGVVGYENNCYHLAIQYNRKKLNLVNKASLEHSFGKERTSTFYNTLNNFKPSFVQYLIIDEWGKNINGSFYLNEMPSYFYTIMSNIFYLPEMPLEMNDSYYREEEQKLKVTFKGIENTSVGECLVFEGETPGGAVRLLINKNLGIPDMMSYIAQYRAYRREKSEKFLLLFVEKKNLKWEEMLKDPELNKALLLSSLREKKLLCDRGIIEKFLKSDDKVRQNLAITYCSLKGIPEGLDLNDYLRADNPIVRFNAAKALFKFKNNRAPLEALTYDEDINLRLRAKQFLTRSSYLIPERNYQLFETIRNFVYSEENNYGKISGNISQVKEVLRFIKPENNWVGGCYKHFISESGIKIQRPYYIYLPEDYDPAELYPMIIFLGGGEGWGDITVKTIYQNLKASNYLSEYILLVPQAQGMWWEVEDERAFSLLLPVILKNYSIDTNRVYMAGGSNGGMGTFFYSTHEPDRFAAIASYMGHPVVKHNPPETEQDREVLKNLINTAIYMIHGEKDKIIQPNGDRLAYKKLSKLNYKIKYEELPERGHDISFAEIKDKIINWFKTNQRNPHPNKIELVMNYPQYNRSYWLRVERTNQLPAKVSAKINDNTIEIKTEGVLSLTVFLDEELVDISKEVIIKINRKQVYKVQPLPTVKCLLKSVRETIDPKLSYGVALVFKID
ncbi:MAG: alpha/beta hydrolase-fold protein [Candidatus Aminicenantia bacterium]